MAVGVFSSVWHTAVQQLESMVRGRQYGACYSGILLTFFGTLLTYMVRIFVEYRRNCECLPMGADLDTALLIASPQNREAEEDGSQATFLLLGSYII
mmetsp:Transcript_18590/g.44542  ORF Transcript_18590/g.44542 Transcript_18590/m.44542 type:complete len:97 (+) Transcript_18590:486-776(+)